MLVEIIDIGVGNVSSVQNLIHKLSVPTRIITKPEDISSEFLILPGVGSAKSYMQMLKETGFDKAVKKHIKDGKKLLGICLGFQVLGEYSQEDGGVECLGVLEGTTKRLENNSSNNAWRGFSIKREDFEKQSFYSQLKLTKKRNIKGRVFFNHEYGFICENDKYFKISIGQEYEKYTAMIVYKNIIGIQFHPEKSQKTGLELISMIL